MSVIVKCGQAICNSLTNKSTAKQMYTFSKAERFPKPSERKEKEKPQNDFYELPSTKTKRFTKFGYGNKSDFTKGDKEIKAELYNKGSDFDPAKPHGPKYSFSNGREKYGKVYLDSVKMYDKDIPGPAKYFVPKTFGSDAPHYSMPGRNENPVTRKNKDDYRSPGPDIYKVVVQISQNGKYPVSGISNVNSMKFGNDKTKRRTYAINKTPGPGEYDSKPMIGQKIFDSRYHSYGGMSILQKYKVKDSRSNYPGPGSYITPSEFGQYQSKDAGKYPKENVYPEENKNKEPIDPRPWRHGMKVIKEKPEENQEYIPDSNGQEEEKVGNENENNGYDENAGETGKGGEGEGEGAGAGAGAGEGGQGQGQGQGENKGEENNENNQEEDDLNKDLPLFNQIISADFEGSYTPPNLNDDF